MTLHVIVLSAAAGGDHGAAAVTQFPRFKLPVASAEAAEGKSTV